MNLKDGEKFALALGLQDHPAIFKKCKKALRPLAAETFNFNLPLFQQPEAMKNFVKKAVSTFPGYFNEKHENYKDRINHLEGYANSYLQKSGKMSPSKNKHATSTTPPVAPPTDIDDKAQRPKPKPLYRAKTTNPSDVPMPDVPNTPNRTVPATLTPDVAAARRVKKPTFPTPTKSGQEVGGATSAGGVSPPNHTVPATPAHTTPVPARVVATTNKPIDATPGSEKKQNSIAPPVLTLQQFLRDCNPSMSHCATAFDIAGVTEGVHLEGMAHWNEKVLRNFIETHHLGRTPLEMEAIFIAISALTPLTC
ncbi:hypothetical protein C8F04DRAFT_1139298 [Mycena alexandri]|uniref:Uncharacterized protein n=1 Tax=Mycena alexandri TaxID=1745969 RepID=A0AAD6S8B4_9AGAR|nr:hypothetical protein C8F04DRAFT_1139298 [Mycena alexandri]